MLFNCSLMSFVTISVFWNQESIKVYKLLWVVVIHLVFLNRKILSHHPLLSLLTLRRELVGCPTSEFVSLWWCSPCPFVLCISYKMKVRANAVFRFRLNIFGKNRSLDYAFLPPLIWEHILCWHFNLASYK